MTCRILSLLILTVCAHAGAADAKFSIDYLHSKPGTITVVKQELGVVFEVRSNFGIGKGSIRLLDGSWPTPSIVRLYLKGLEGVSVSSATKKLSKFDLEIKKSSKDGISYFEFRLPESFLSQTKTIHISWVDFYR